LILVIWKKKPLFYFWASKELNLSAFFLLIGVSILVAGSFLAAFLWSVKHGQYDDDHTPSIRILFDDEPKTNKP
jgi:cbb3-type cytochrome oxidase maturation protein